MAKKRLYATKEEATKVANRQRYARSKEHRTAFSIRLNNDTQKDVIDFLKAIPNKQKVIVEAIRDYMKK